MFESLSQLERIAAIVCNDKIPGRLPVYGLKVVGVSGQWPSQETVSGKLTRTQTELREESPEEIAEY